MAWLIWRNLVKVMAQAPCGADSRDSWYPLRAAVRRAERAFLPLVSRETSAGHFVTPMDLASLSTSASDVSNAVIQRTTQRLFASCDQTWNVHSP